jgi:hypothetical protein
MPKPAACPATGGRSASASSSADRCADNDAGANRRHGAAAHASRGAARTAAHASRGAARTKDASRPDDTRFNERAAASQLNERAAINPPNGHDTVSLSVEAAASRPGSWKRLPQ